MKHCPMEFMKADLMTKPSEAVKTAKFVEALGFVT